MSPGSATTEANRTLLERLMARPLVELFKENRGEFCSYFTEDVVWAVPPGDFWTGGVRLGIEAVIDLYNGMLKRAPWDHGEGAKVQVSMDPATERAYAVLADENVGFVLHHNVLARGDGERLEFPLVILVRFRDGKISEFREFLYDPAEVFSFCRGD